MRILFLSNLYPPHDLGGWEQHCQEMVEGLRARGHQCHVLTSHFGTRGALLAEEGVSRLLSLDADIYHYRPLDFFIRRPSQQRSNRRALGTALNAFRPDVVFIWGMWNLSRSLAHFAEQWRPGRVAYAIAGYWFIEPDSHESFWQCPSRRASSRALLGPARALALHTLAKERAAHPLALGNVACVSQHVLGKLTAAGVLPKGGRVIYVGIDPEPFLRCHKQALLGQGRLRMVYTGSLVPHKGVVTAIEALGILRQRDMADGLHLDIVGGGHPEYEAYLRKMTAELGLLEQVTFVGRVPRSEIPDVLSRMDLFLFTSLWEEPIARSVMEAMASGLAVIGTPVGGQREMLEDGINSLTFEPGDPVGLGECILRLKDDHDLRARLAHAGQQMVLSRFTLGRMTDEVEAWLEASCQDAIPRTIQRSF